MLPTPVQRYAAAIESGLLMPDKHQAGAVERLERCFQVLLNNAPDTKVSEKGLYQSFWQGVKHCFGVGSKTEVVEANSLGCYIWGGVGRGKTHLMDYFFDAVPAHLNAKRTHFHRFMKEIHGQLHHMKGVKNPLDVIAAKFAADYDVICLDEFVVIDITDAMLLGGLTQALFRNGLVLITTSNVAPEDLYKDGLQRARFLPTIATLEANLDIYHLDSDSDYRMRHLLQHETYVVCTDDIGAQEMGGLFKELVNEEPKKGLLEINGRQIQYNAMHNDVIWFDFGEICGNMRSVSDYIELAQEFHTVLLSRVPVLDSTLDDQARRFVHLIDEFYDCKVKTILTARAPIYSLYTGDKLAFEFQRTESRLVEMQSQDYLSLHAGAYSSNGTGDS